MGRFSKPGNSLLLVRTNRNVDVRGHLELRAHQNFNSPVELGGGNGRNAIRCGARGTLRLCSLRTEKLAGTKPGCGVQTRRPPFHHSIRAFCGNRVAFQGDQKIRSECFRLPAAPTPARVKLKPVLILITEPIPGLGGGIRRKAHNKSSCKRIGCRHTARHSGRSRSRRSPRRSAHAWSGLHTRAANAADCTWLPGCRGWR